MNIYYPAWAFWFSVVQFIFNVALLIGVWWNNKQKVNSKKFKGLEDRMVKVETAVTSMPVCGNHTRMEENDRITAKQLKEISDDLHEIKGLVKGRMEGIGSALDTIQQHLLGGGR